MIRLNQQIISISIAFFAAIAQGISAQTTDWYPIATENRPFVRWWWLGSAVDHEGLNFNLEEFAAKGLGGVEITPIYGVRDNEANDISYLSPRWMGEYAFCIEEGNRLGLQIDMNNGTGWPFGGPNISTDHSARKCVVESWDVAPGNRLTEKICPKDKKQRPVATLQAIIAVNGDKRIDITDKFKADSILNWKAPGKQPWKVYAIFSGRTFQKVKRAAPGGEGLVLNHYDKNSVEHYLSRFDSVFDSGKYPIPNTFFNDSYEVYGADWADNILEEFYNDHGYRLELFIPEFIDKNNHTDFRGALLRDYRYTLGRMLRDNFTLPWVRWAHAKGARIRNQAHGSPANIIDLYAAVDIPECESFGQSDFDLPDIHRFGPSRQSDAAPAVLKFASSAAHITGKRLTSAETLTWLTEHFCTALSGCKPEIDQMFCAGVNHVYFHGAPYSPKGAEFPGWMFYASINMSPTNSIWRDADALMDYVSRCQAFLSAGTPDNDFLLYFPIEDIWHNQRDGHYLMFEIHKMQQRAPEVYDAVDRIIKSGYDSDYVSDALLETLGVDSDGLITSPGANYKALIVPAAKWMDPKTLNRILDLAEKGATVIFIGQLPHEVPGLSNKDARKQDLDATIEKLPEMSAEPLTHRYGLGRIILSPDIEGALNLTGVPAEELRTRAGVSMIRRNNEVGGHNYFVSMLTYSPVDQYFTLAVPCEDVEIFDPVTGEKGRAATRKTLSGQTQFRLQIKPGQSLLLKTFPYKVDIEPWRYWRYEPNKCEALDIDRGWSVSFVESQPAIDGVFFTDTLTQWCNLPVPEAKVNFGTASYTVQYDVPDPSVANDWLLDLGDVRESAMVYINDKPVGKLWCAPFTIKVGDYLVPGKNTLRVDVTNLQANRIADFERRGVKWRIFKDANIASVTNAKEFTFADWPVAPSGLNSGVRLIPIFYDNK